MITVWQEFTFVTMTWRLLQSKTSSDSDSKHWRDRVEDELFNLDLDDCETFTNTEDLLSLYLRLYGWTWTWTLTLRTWLDLMTFGLYLHFYSQEMLTPWRAVGIFLFFPTAVSVFPPRGKQLRARHVLECTVRNSCRPLAAQRRGKKARREWKRQRHERKKRACSHVSLRWKQRNMESNLSQHPEIVPVDKLISLNINVERFIPPRRGLAAPKQERFESEGLEIFFPSNHQIWQQRKTQIDCLNELNTDTHTRTHTLSHTHLI